MTKEQINIALASVLETLDETEGGLAPEGMLAAAVEAGMPAAAGRWSDIAAMLVHAGLCERSFMSVMSITARGREIAEMSRAHRKAVRT